MPKTMKNALLFLLCFILMAQKCQKKEPMDVSTVQTDDCIDPTKIRKDMACTMIYKPVCGCDGVTYPSDCVAENSGVLTWTAGACEPSEENPSI